MGSEDERFVGNWRRKDDPLFTTIVGNDPDGVRAALSEGANPNARDRFDRTPLMMASCCPEIADILLPVSDHSAVDRNGKTALIWACCMGNANTVRLFLPFSDPDAVDEDGWTALMHSASMGDTASVRLLLPVTDAGIRDARGRSARDLAQWRGLGADLIEGFARAQAEERELGKGSALAHGGPRTVRRL